MYIKSTSQWRGEQRDSTSIVIYIDKKHLRMPRIAATLSSDPAFEFYISGCFAKISPHYLSRHPSVIDPMAKVDFANPSALDDFYKLVKRAVGKLLNSL